MRQEILFEEAPGCAVGLSEYGQGLFSLRDFAVGSVVVDYSNTPIKEVAFEDLPEEVKACHWWVGKDETTAEVFPPESLFMRANHSRSCNCTWDRENRRLIACRVIRPGDEVTFDYRLEVAPGSIKDNPPDWA